MYTDMDIDNVLGSSNVMRWHTVAGVNHQTIAHHSWGVALLCQHFDPRCSKALILAALLHDCAELVTGDIPATAKWRDPKLKHILEKIESEVEVAWGINSNVNLSPPELKLLKLCDWFEGMNYCIEQYHLGSSRALHIFDNWVEYINTNANFNDFEYRISVRLLNYNNSLASRMDLAVKGSRL
jgi:5'-deoxynucleotidase YfbR-like HD superfamily hydrolase